MTTEEKAKAYDEALERARNVLQTDLHESGVWAIIKIFPELSESEDEEIRKELVEFINHYRYNTDLTSEQAEWCHKALTWLEKQKEQKQSINIDQLKSLMLQYLQEAANEKDDSDIEADTDKWARKILEYDFEQKPVEWSEKDKDYYDAIITKLEVTQDDALLTDNQIDFLKSLPERFNLQPKQEWSEEDKHRCGDAIYFLETAKKHYADTSEIELTIKWLKSLQPQAKQEWSEDDKFKLEDAITGIDVGIGFYEREGKHPNLLKAIIEAKEWLKSLHPQSKKELSIEKAIKWLDDTFYFLDNSSGRGKDCEITTHAFDSLKEMYDSFRKAVIVDSEPHWKPSEEQMDSLRDTIVNTKGYQYSVYLPELYEQLKKLM